MEGGKNQIKLFFKDFIKIQDWHDQVCAMFTHYYHYKLNSVHIWRWATSPIIRALTFYTLHLTPSPPQKQNTNTTLFHREGLPAVQEMLPSER